MSNPRESELSYPLGEALPAPGGVLELAPGVRWVRMGLPFALDHINLWLLRDRIDGPDGEIQGWSIVDCGICNEATQAQWEQVFEQHLDGLPVLRVIVTHFHPDHMGLAHWLTEKWSGRAAGPPQGAASPLGGQRSGAAASVGANHECRLWISATDYNLARVASGSTVGMGGEAAAAFFGSHGLTDPDALAKIRGRASYYPSMVPAVPASYRRLMDGQRLSIGGKTWHCIVGYGHAPEHISLHCEELGILISGDMVLPRISTNVSVVDVEPEADPLTLYLDSLARLLELPADTLVLPAHGKPFRGLHARVDQLRQHHDERLAEVLAACAARPCHAAELLELLFKRKLDLHQTTFAMGESVAHLNALWLAGKLRRTLEEDGVYRFAAA
jgi:glyoxylase-like metal-dependent hydrolase (beta-lactamase superfamily II)